MNDLNIFPSKPKEGSRSRSEWAHWKGSGNVLLVEDDREVRTLVAHVLERHGFTVSPAANGRSALAAFNDDPDKFVLVVIHYNLPGKDAASVLHALRAKRPEIAAVLTSSYATTDVGRAVEDLKSCAFLPKPFTIDGLIRTIHGVLQQ